MIRSYDDRLIDLFWLLTASLLSALWCLGAARELGATFDEPCYLRAGLDCWHTGSCRELIALGTMPLPATVATFPLRVQEWWQGARLDLTSGQAEALVSARATTLIFWFLLLGYGMAIARQLAGPWAGRLAVVLLACEPNLLAHASLATTDVPLTACLLAFLCHFQQGRAASLAGRVVLPVCWFALLTLAKASGPVFAVLLVLVLEAARLGWRGSARQYLSALAHIVLIAAAGSVLAVLVCGWDWRPVPALHHWADSVQAGWPRDAARWLAQHCQFARTAAEAFVRQVMHNGRGHAAFLLGVSHQEPVWYYFPALLLIKAPLALLSALAVLAICNWRCLCKKLSEKGSDPLPNVAFSQQAGKNAHEAVKGLTPFRMASNWPGLAALCLLLCSVQFKVQIGIRLILPVVALGVIAVAVGLTRVSATSDGWRRGLFASLRVCIVLGLCVSTLRVWPHGLCYTNELFGATRDGYLHVSDSNFDWGQGLPELRDWACQRQLAELDVWYFGCDQAIEQPPFRQVPLHTLNPKTRAAALACLQSRYLAVSTTLLYGAYQQEQAVPLLRWLRGQQPESRTTTFLIYDVSQLQAGSPGGG